MIFLDCYGFGMLFYLIVMLIASGWGVVSYIFQSLGLYTIAKRRGVNAPGLAWVPVLNAWTVGAISDDYRQKAHGQKKNRRKLLLGLNIGLSAVMILWVIALIFVIVLVLNGIPPYDMCTEMACEVDYMPPQWGEMMEVFLVLAVLGFLLLTLVMLGLCIPVAIFRWMSLYDIFRSCDRKKGLIFFLVSLAATVIESISGLEGIFLFICRNKDDGMTPISEPEALPPAEETEE